MKTGTIPLRFALLGHPTGHSASPAMHTAALRLMGLPHIYEAIDCPMKSAFDRALSLLRRGYFAGLNVTAPYKASALEQADDASPEARRIGAANTIVLNDGKIVAYNTDAPAMVEQLQEAGVRPGVALIMGSGGAARAALWACQQLGFRVIGVTSRSWADTESLYESPRAQAFRDERALTLPWPGSQPQEERSKGSMALMLQWGEMAAMADLIVQATSASLSPGNQGDAVASTIPWASVPDRALAYELAYGPTLTPFEAAAQRRGIRRLDGLELLARQGARSLSLWLGQAAPFEVMLRAAQRKVAGV